MAGPSPGPLVSSSQTGSVHNVVFYLQQQQHGNGNQFVGEVCHSQNVNTYMQAQHNRYRSDGNVKCFPADNYSFERDAGNAYWSYQQQPGQHQMQQQQQWQQWSQSDYTDKSCWTQQQQQQVHQRHVVNNSCMAFNSYPHQVQQQHQQSSSYYRSNVVATVTVQSAVTSQSRTPSRCDSVRSETCDSHCSSGMDVDMGTQQQQYNMYQNYHQQQQHQMPQQFYQSQSHHQDQQQMMQQQLHQQQLQQQQHQQQQQQCYWSSSTSHYDMQQLDHHGQQQDQQMDYFNQSQHNQYYRQYMQQQQQQPHQQQSHVQQTYYQQQQQQQQLQQQQQQQQQQMSSCYWQREQTSVTNNQRPFTTVVPMMQNDPSSMVVQTPACSSSPVGADTTTTSPAPYHNNHHHQYQAPTPTPSPDDDVQPPRFAPADDSLEQSIDEGLSSVIGDDVDDEEDVADEVEEEERDDDDDEDDVDDHQHDEEDHRQEEPTSGPALASVPAGWTRDVSAGSVTYISPGGYRVRSLTEAADYVQRDGTCKCGLPCPLRLELVFNFDASVSNRRDEERRSTSTCCRHSTPDGAKEEGSGEATSQDARPVDEREPRAERAQEEEQEEEDVGADVALIEADAAAEDDAQPMANVKRKIEACTDAPAPPPPMKMAKVQPNVRAPASPKLVAEVEPKVEQAEPATNRRNDCEHEQLLGDLLDCIPDSMEDVLDRHKEATAAAVAAAAASATAEEKAEKAVKKVAIVRTREPVKAIKPLPPPLPQQQAAPLPKLPVPPMPKQQKIASVAPVLAPVVVKTKPPPLAIRPGTPATAARSRAKVAAELSAKNANKRSPRRATQTITIQGGMKMLQAVPQPQQQQLIQQQPQHQQQQNFWPANIAPLRTASFPFAYQTQAGAGTPVFSTATTLRPGMGPMTFLTQAPQAGGGPHGANVFANPPLPVITTRPALAPSGQVVHVLTTGPTGPMLTTAPEPSVPILTVGPVNPAMPGGGGGAANANRGFTRTGKKRKSTPQTVASILQQATVTPPQPHAAPHPPTLTLTQQPEPLVYNVQNFQQIQPQPTIQTLALMPDGKTYVVVNSQPAPPQPTQQAAPTAATAGHWLLSPRAAPAQQTLIAPAPQPVNVFCAAPSAFVLNGTSAPQVLQLHDGTIVQTTTEQPNVLANYGGLFIRCPPAASAGAQVFSAPQTVRAVPIPIAPGRSPGRSPDSSSADGVTSTVVPEKVACGEATPPQTLAVVKAAHPSPVVQSSQIDSCVHEETEKSGTKKPGEFNNNVHWLKPPETDPVAPAR